MFISSVVGVLGIIRRVRCLMKSNGGTACGAQLNSRFDCSLFMILYSLQLHSYYSCSSIIKFNSIIAGTRFALYDAYIDVFKFVSYAGVV